jgi:hypothetical protein
MRVHGIGALLAVVGFAPILGASAAAADARTAAVPASPAATAVTPDAPPPSPAAAPAPPAIGPFRLGMSLAEVRAAVPSVEWQDVMVSRATGRVFSMRSDGTVPIGGVEFGVEALAHYYEHRLQLDGAREVADAAACERAALELLAAIDSQAGPFTSTVPRTTPASGGGLYWQTQRSASGSITVVPTPAPGTPARTDGETLTFGQGSTVLVETFDAQYRPRPRIKRLGGPPEFLQMTARNRGDRHEVQVEIAFGGAGGSACAMHVDLRSWVPPPLPQAFDTSTAKLVREASIAERHLVHAPLAGRAGPAIDVELGCEIDRRSGWALGCGVLRPDDLDFETERVAIDLTRLVAYDVSGVDRDDPQNMRGTVRVRVDPGARRPLDFLAAPRTPLDDVELLERPDPEAARVVSRVLRQDEDEETGVEVPLVCRIETDGSLICVDPQGATEPERRAVVATASRVAATAYRAAPALLSGAASAGKVVELAVQVQPAF